MSDGLRRNTMLGSSSSNNSGGGGTSTSGSYTVNLNGQWELATTPTNPDSALYDGVYRSDSNYNVNNSAAIMYITIKDCSSFQVYIRSSSEANWDYVMISQLDQTIGGNTDYSNTILVKAHTHGNKQSGTALSNYTLVEYTGITAGEHIITVVYRKDSSSHSGDDRGYVLIPKLQSGGDSEEDGGNDEGPIDINNYLTIEALENGLTANLSTNACEYCIDGYGVWYTLAANTTTPSINQGQVISFRGNLTPSSSNGIGTFTISKKCNLKGNCMSMLFGNNAGNNYSLSGKDYAFYRLFDYCYNIIEVSSNFLSAITLAENCYSYMFRGCTSLTTAPELPATTLIDSCYYGMFMGCTSLTTAPELPATTLASSCYNSMLQNCTSLTTAPELPATTLVYSCYRDMLSACTSLIEAPELPATTLANYCYYGMFNDCISLTKTPKLPITNLAIYCYNRMFKSCTSLTTTPELPAITLKNACYSNMFYGCTSLITAPKLPATTLADSCYQSMFSHCTSLITAPELPATKLAEDCYNSMFDSCTSITTAPKLPATTLANYCYYDMFSRCTSLIEAPELPATTLAESCYGGMFIRCTSLTKAPELPATKLVKSCYYAMFGSCTSLITAPKLHAVVLADLCYNSMFDGCESLTTSPVLPATELVTSCYFRMFDGCKQLNYINAMFTTTPSSSYTDGWVKYVSSTGIFVKNAEATWNVTGIHGIPNGWTVIEEAPYGNTLTISIYGGRLTYTANPGMTWEEFIIGKSEFSIENSFIYINFQNTTIPQAVLYDGTVIPVHKNHTLINLHDYDTGNNLGPA